MLWKMWTKKVTCCIHMNLEPLSEKNLGVWACAFTGENKKPKENTKNTYIGKEGTQLVELALAYNSYGKTKAWVQAAQQQVSSSTQATMWVSLPRTWAHQTKDTSRFHDLTLEDKQDEYCLKPFIILFGSLTSKPINLAIKIQNVYHPRQWSLIWWPSIQMKPNLPNTG